MITKLTAFTILVVTLTGCASAQRGAVSKAEKAYEKNEYQTCLRHLNRAESYGKHSDVVSAQVFFNRGLCLEGSERSAEAVAAYKFLAEAFPSSSLTGQAKARIERIQSSPIKTSN